MNCERRYNLKNCNNGPQYYLQSYLYKIYKFGDHRLYINAILQQNKTMTIGKSYIKIFNSI